MTKHATTALLGSLLLLPATAGEHEVQPAPFEKVLRLDATLLPAEPIPFSIDPDAWESFAIAELVPHGSTVKKGQAIAVLETEAIDRRISDDKEAAKLRKKGLANAKRELVNLRSATPRRLEASRRAQERAQFDLAYFRKIGRKEKERSAERAVERAERSLEYQNEELTQLLAMYREDDLTEETEEIILKRQRNTVKDAKEFLERTRLARDRALETDIPREAEDLAEAAQEALLAYASARETIPRALEMKRIEVAQLEVADKRADEKFAELQADRKLMDLTSPAEGLLYYGDLSEGSWNVGQTSKFMKEGGSLPFKTVFATVIPKGGAMEVHGKLEEGQLMGLKTGLTGTFAPKAMPRSRYPVQLKELSFQPDLGGKYAVAFALPEGAGPLVPGMSGRVSVVSVELPEALAIPVSAVQERGNGELFVKVKVAEGDPEERVIQLGPEADGKVVVEAGLKAGDVVVTKEKEGE